MRTPRRDHRATTAAGLLLLTAALAPPVGATHNTPVRAKSIKVDFVRAFPDCTTPNATTSNGLPACIPVVEPDPCGFGPMGYGQMKSIASGVDVRIKGKLKGLNQACENSVLTFAVDVNATSDDCGGNACTVSLTLFPITSCVVSRGECAIDTTVDTVLPGTILPGKGLNMGLRLGTFTRGVIPVFEAGLLIP